jgi:DNA invertase Pin-like site-specific DNA recombinase
MIRAYARVSTEDQTTDPQLAELERAGAQIIYQDVASGASRKRPELARLLSEIRAGDTLLVVRLDRLARSLAHLLEIVDTLQKRGCFFRSLADNFDTTTAQGRMLLGFLGTIAEFERSLIAERTKAGLRSAREQGRVGGNPHLKDKSDLAARRQISLKRRAAYLDGLRASHARWLPTIELLRPHAPWDLVLRRLRRADPSSEWTKPKLLRAVRGLIHLGMADERLLARAEPLAPDEALPRLVASIVRGRPDLTIRQVGAELESLSERTPRGSRTWSPSSVVLQMERARVLGFLPPQAHGKAAV